MIIISPINFKQWLVGYNKIILTSHIKEYIENTQKLNNLITANGTTHWSWEKMQPFCRSHYQMHFLLWNYPWNFFPGVHIWVTWPNVPYPIAQPQWAKTCSDTCINYISSSSEVNTLRPRQNGRHFPDDIFKWIFLNENVWILIKISLKFVPRGPINNIPTLVQVMAWRRPGDKPLSEPMMDR